MTLTEFTRRFSTEEACRQWLEDVRWPQGPVCPRCRTVGRSSRVTTRNQWTCLECRHRYSVTSGTVLHGTRLPLRTWLLATYLIVTSSKGVSALRLVSLLGVSYRTAWHLGHRVRAMMAGTVTADEHRLLRGVVELDETYVGGKPRHVHAERTLPRGERPRRKKGRATEKACLFVAIGRESRFVRTRIVPSHTARALSEAMRDFVAPSATILTDELPAYRAVGREYARHLSVCHSRDEYARTAPESGLRIHINTAESFNATLKRAIVGVFHSVSRKHLARYATEAAFRWSARGSGAMAKLTALFAISAAATRYRTLVA